MKGGVKNKKIRHNLTFAEKSQEPDYENKKGRIVNFNDLECLARIKYELVGVLDEPLVAEGNHYYDIEECGIGFHGDAERKLVFALRLGSSIPLHYQWFLRFQSIGKRVKISLNSGDMYMMSEKAVGQDWLKSSMLTLRHAAGCQKSLTIKKKRKRRTK